MNNTLRQYNSTKNILNGGKLNTLSDDNFYENLFKINNYDDNTDVQPQYGNMNGGYDNSFDQDDTSFLNNLLKINNYEESDVNYQNNNVLLSGGKYGETESMDNFLNKLFEPINLNDSKYD